MEFIYYLLLLFLILGFICFKRIKDDADDFETEGSQKTKIRHEGGI